MSMSMVEIMGDDSGVEDFDAYDIPPKVMEELTESDNLKEIRRLKLLVKKHKKEMREAIVEAVMTDWSEVAKMPNDREEEIKNVHRIRIQQLFKKFNCEEEEK
jgi:hypothetical protein